MPRTPYILLVDPGGSLGQVLHETIRSVGNLQLVTVPGVDEALDRLGREPADLVLVHQAEGEDASEAVRLLRELKSRKRPVATLVLSDRHRADEALTLLRLGAVDYLSRPLDLNRIAYLIDGLTLRARYAAPRSAAPPAEDPGLIRQSVHGEAFFYQRSRKMGRLMEQIARVAPRDASILLGGET